MTETRLASARLTAAQVAAFTREYRDRHGDLWPAETGAALEAQFRVADSPAAYDAYVAAVQAQARARWAALDIPRMVAGLALQGAALTAGVAPLVTRGRVPWGTVVLAALAALYAFGPASRRFVVYQARLVWIGRGATNQPAN